MSFDDHRRKLEIHLNHPLNSLESSIARHFYMCGKAEELEKSNEFLRNMKDKGKNET